jgi:subtilase family serine protease
MLNRDFLQSYAKLVSHGELEPHATGRPWFKVNEIASLYNIPSPTSAKIVVGVISFGGGLVGDVDQNGKLTNGDVQSYWTYLGIAPENMPTVLIKPILGATNNPGATDGSTDENTLDVETIGGCCPTSNLTIILYIAPNSLSSFGSVFTYALNTPIVYNLENLLPTILSVSWGAPEIFFTNLSAIDALFKQATLRGINICVASGDNGSSDGLRGGNYVDFPSSSPNVVAVGGTRLVSVANTYSGATLETAWTGSGGGFSRTFLKPAYQSTINGTFRASPDVGLDADPSTGVIFLVKGQYVIYGGTSVSAPTMAGYLACINPSSFVNPRLYTASSSCFHDVVTGSNGAYSGRVGYDNCTGLGSIVGGQLQSVLTAQVTLGALAISPTSMSISAGASQQATVTFTPLTATPPSLLWTTSNPAIATVNSQGLILGVGNGSAQIRATSTSNSAIFANVTVLVSTRVTGVTLNVSTLALNLRTLRFYQLTPTVSPPTASIKTVTWTTTRPAVAVVSASGLVTVRTAGTTSIQVTTTDGTFRAVCAVTVTA